MYGKGISREGEIVDLAVKSGIIEKAGSWFSYKTDKIGQGKENAKDFLLKNPKIMKEIEEQIIKNHTILDEILLDNAASEEVEETENLSTKVEDSKKK
jgi:recombination protein RecA